MYYHVIFRSDGDTIAVKNLEKSYVVDSIVLPFINGQVTLVRYGGRINMVNMKAVPRVSIYRSEKEINENISKVISSVGDEDCDVTECTSEVLRDVRLMNSNQESRSLLQKTFSETKPQVFVIMKFGDALLDSAYEGVIRPVIKSFGLSSLRVDEVENSGKISEQILEGIASSKYVLADLTGERPNCYYECGFAHALGKELILTINSKEKIHFDLADHRFISWSTEAELRQALMRRFKILEPKKASTKRRKMS